MLDFDKYEVLTFDCYGTLIDWETGILAALRSVLAAAGKRVTSDGEILTRYAEIESKLETEAYRTYKETLRMVVDRFGEKMGFEPIGSERDCLVHSLGSWPPFSDTVASLGTLKQRYKLAIISNTDDDLFMKTARTLEVAFDWVVTAEQARAYKPSAGIFEFAFERIGLPRNQMLHVAQSIYHDIVPAKSLGLSTVWVNRRKGKVGPGAARPAIATPDLEVPDLASLVLEMGL
ncbi:MAG: haloacid dehalogenase type II [Candidatus Latescibacteria bacterium]|nr:haloacid dehalogenase type II [Candidatus Latescibacterota bacterium]NIM21693.1 haloacid dehalogenase type II [Candidatus Latescibacterota bacterium]NIM65720.1 haloacid dehalogenase type II [Candidatus Latescibacterota bacterium]NIO02105.1 haloacid dehalogenase type II [Candidatus Latescibacterota bacterium]NIO28922.1 haloacid dehalogenase type II [Candidatus Latescibacterota bacterium]